MLFLGNHFKRPHLDNKKVKWQPWTTLTKNCFPPQDWEMFHFFWFEHIPVTKQEMWRKRIRKIQKSKIYVFSFLFDYVDFLRVNVKAFLFRWVRRWWFVKKLRSILSNPCLIDADLMSEKENIAIFFVV